MAMFDDCEIIEFNSEHLMIKLKNGNIMEIISSSGNIKIYEGDETPYIKPTYEELYEHWLKTKDKPKKKRKPEQLSGQLDMFDVIDKENKDDSRRYN